MKKIQIKRILVALDASTVDRNILQAGIALATRFNARLDALFIEDIDLLHVAELPFVREVVYGAAVGRSINVAGMERSIQTQTARLRKLVASIAQQNQIEIALSVLRGNVASMLCDASRQTDLLIIGKNTQLLEKSQKIGSITRFVLSTARCNVAVLQFGSNIERPVVVSFTGSEASQHALSLAIELAHEDHNQLIVLLPAVEDSKYQQLSKAVSESVDDYSLNVSLIRLTNNTAEQILQVVHRHQGRLLLLESGSTFLSETQKQTLITQANVPVILLH
ncbi:universal stress protein [Nitrosomonas sp.]|uniref:universal stress protein n=1 Tax=Nitrosomonas sp. TaxID=42353 RepID=UPI001E1765CB|nr:universal stress protein [Nitrosomonas sp.]MCB1950126.1 universal stress protein [Nitrosomonas sp.]